MWFGSPGCTYLRRCQERKALQVSDVCPTRTGLCLLRRCMVMHIPEWRSEWHGGRGFSTHYEFPISTLMAAMAYVGLVRLRAFGKESTARASGDCCPLRRYPSLSLY